MALPAVLNLIILASAVRCRPDVQKCSPERLLAGFMVSTPSLLFATSLGWARLYINRPLALQQSPAGGWGAERQGSPSSLLARKAFLVSRGGDSSSVSGLKHLGVVCLGEQKAGGACGQGEGV